MIVHSDYRETEIFLPHPIIYSFLVSIRYCSIARQFTVIEKNDLREWIRMFDKTPFRTMDTKTENDILTSTEHRIYIEKTAVSDWKLVDRLCLSQVKGY